MPKRCDHLPLLEANPGKIRALRDLLRAFRAAAPDVAADQWQRFFETGQFNKQISDKTEDLPSRLLRAKARVGAARIQMLRYQVVGQLKSFMSNRANDFRDLVLGSSVDETTRHQLLTINDLEAWFRRDPIVMKKTGAQIPDDVRHLARRIMHCVLARHRRPRFHRLNPNIDARHVAMAPAVEAGFAPLWIEIATLDELTGPEAKALRARETQRAERRGRPEGRMPRAKDLRRIHLPLKSYSYHEARCGTVANTIQIIERGADSGRPGEIVIGVTTDMEEPFAKSRADYRPLREELTLDLGLATMFATPDGDLLGRAWRDQLERHDRRISELARTLQKQGIRPNQSRRYRARVAAFRGFLKTEIGRVLNRLIVMKRPAHVVIERLDFSAPGLSRRLNRILARMGHAVIEAKLNDLAERTGLTWEEVNPAYSSQTCSNEHCGYVAKTNRKRQADFVCGCCGHKIHADVNAARNLESGRSAFDRSARYTKAECLRLTVHRHLERMSDRRPSPATDGRPRDRVIPDRAAIVSNPYYRDALDRLTAATPLTAADKFQRPPAPDQAAVRPPQDLVADVSAG